MPTPLEPPHRRRLRSSPAARVPTGHPRPAGQILLLLGVLCSVVVAAGSATPSAEAATPSLTWTNGQSAGGVPALWDPAMAYDDDIHAVVLFGGTLADGTPSGETWIFNGSSWSQAGGGPAARTGASIAYDAAAHQLILFGGLNAQGVYLNDTWAWNGASWYLDSPSGSQPPGRQGGALAADRSGNLVLFGGTGAATAVATPGQPATTVGGSPSTLGPMAGGTPTTLDDTWTWNGMTWTHVLPSSSPPARTDAAATYDQVHSQTVLVGGTSSPDGAQTTSAALSDTWTWDGSTWSRATPATSPPARANAALTGDPDVGGALLYGGSNDGTALNDSWAWTGSTWAPLSPSGAPPPTAAPGVAYDAATGEVVVYGGQPTVGAPVATTYLLGRSAVPSPTSQPTASTTTIPPPLIVPTVLGPGASATTTATTSTTSAPALSHRATPPTTAHSSAPVVTTPASSPGSPVEQVRPGASVLLLGAGFLPDARIEVTFHSAPRRIGVFSANTDGTFSATVQVPDGAAAGTHHFEMSGRGKSGSMTNISTAVLVVASLVVHHGAGLQTPILVAVAVLLPVGTWAGLVLAGRRRARTTNT